MFKLHTKQFQILMSEGKSLFENIVEKEEIAGNQHFLLFPQCFQLCKEQILPFE